MGKQLPPELDPKTLLESPPGEVDRLYQSWSLDQLADLLTEGFVASLLESSPGIIALLEDAQITPEALQQELSESLKQMIREL